MAQAAATSHMSAHKARRRGPSSDTAVLLPLGSDHKTSLLQRVEQYWRQPICPAWCAAPGVMAMKELPAAYPSVCCQVAIPCSRAGPGWLDLSQYVSLNLRHSQPLPLDFLRVPCWYLPAQPLGTLTVASLMAGMHRPTLP